MNFGRFGRGSCCRQRVMTDILFPTLAMPFAGTAIGAAAVFALRRSLPGVLRRIMAGFAAGVMTGAAVWSLLLPAIELSQRINLPTGVPAAAGFLAGMAILLLLDHSVPHLHPDSVRPEGPRTRLGRTAKLTLAVTLHNIPEGMAVGIVLAAAMRPDTGITAAAALALSFGIAVQNIPEGAIVSMPMRSDGNGRFRSFMWGVLSGAVEPAAGAVTLLLADALLPWLPWLLSTAAGAMMYVVVEELIPESQNGSHSDSAVVAFAAGFVLMMLLELFC